MENTHTTEPLHPTFSSWLIFSVCLLSNILAGQVSTLMSVYLPTVLESLLQATPSDEASITLIGTYITAIYLLGWTIGGFFCGLISDRIGRVRSFALSMGLLGLFTLLISFAHTWEMILVYRFLTGLGAGGIMVISVTYLSEVWPKNSRNIMIGIVSIGFPIGIFSSGMVNLLSEWREGFLFGTIPLVLAIFALFGLKESEPWKQSKTFISKISSLELVKQYRAELLHGTVIFGTMLIGLWAVFSWFPTWVQSLLQHNDGQKERGFAMMLFGVGGLIGGFSSGWISKSLGVRQSMMLCFGGCTIMAALLFGSNSTFSWLIYAETVILALFFGLSQGLLSFYIPQLFPTAIRAGATGFCFNLGRIFTTFAVFSLGALVDTLGGYSNALLIFSLVFVLGFLKLFFGQNFKPEIRLSQD
ncbi:MULTISPECIES: MFS transporter [unclassified Arenibacter]|uniref:MFS transporter n=1 Tax=unclassified Arenibacter TaxID=2615047 RepID=UPI000E357C39|nr:MULTISPECIES: MFS transporter [unclassified Arenibacter]MCM4165392.1 MFS transporter [Arenibacter sp. A80]RFT54869.1 MFS transporter [Arenibacter sp. P308M17]